MAREPRVYVFGELSASLPSRRRLDPESGSPDKAGPVRAACRIWNVGDGTGHTPTLVHHHDRRYSFTPCEPIAPGTTATASEPSDPAEQVFDLIAAARRLRAEL